MKTFAKNSKGSIAVSCLLIGMLLIMVGISSLTLAMNDYYKTLSNSDAVKAYYLAEMGIEIGINNIMETIENALLKYLEDLKISKIDYIKSVDIEGHTEIEYTPPIFNNYIKQLFLDELHNFNATENNPLVGYLMEHYYNLLVEYDPIETVIVMKSLGGYKNARKQIIVKIHLPFIVDDGFDIYGLPKIKIHPAKITSYYQVIITN